MRSILPMRTAKIGYIVISIIFAFLGGLMIIFPDLSIRTIAGCVGSVMILFGIIKLIGYYSKDLFRLAFQFDMEFGILSIIIGILILDHTNAAISFMTTALGITIFAEGLFKIRIAADSRRFGIRSWPVIMLLAVISCIFGVVLIYLPDSSARFLTVMLGIELLAEAALSFSVALFTVKIIRNQRPDRIDKEWEV